MFTRIALKNIVLILVLLCLSSISRAQSYQQLNHRIDSLSKKKLPKSALIEVDKLDALARKENNAPMQVKAAIYRMMFQSVMEENVFVAIIGRLKQDIKRSDYPVKPVLQSILANMYLNYYRQNRFNFSRRTPLVKPDTDFTRWDLQTIHNEISNNFKLSLQNYQLEQRTPIGVLDGVLTGDKSQRYLRPTLYDMLVQRAFDFFLSPENYVIRPKNEFALNNAKLFGDSHTFATLKINSSDTASILYQGIQYLQQATLFHLQAGSDEEALADLDLKRLELLHREAILSDKDSLYLNALRQIEKLLAAKPISADAWVLHGKYFFDNRDMKSARSYFAIAANAYPESVGGKNAANYLRQIQHKELLAMVEDVSAPGKPMLALLNYQNVQAAHVVVYKISATQYNQLAKIPSDINRNADGLTIYASDSVFKYLAKLTPVTDKKVELPDPQDYLTHTTEFKIDPLKSGHYVLTVRDGGTDEPELTSLTAFKVCRLSYVLRRSRDNDVEIKVTDRETGAPLPGVQVTFAETQHTITDANGSSHGQIEQSGSVSVKLTTATDTLYVASNYVYGIPNVQKIQTSTVIFTDRQIYRPGQTIYFKGLHLQTQNTKSTLLTNEKVTVQIRDNNQKLLTSIPVTTNEFGTFSGTYALPQNMLNGEVFITTGDGSKYVQVEEYKRPSFEVEFLPVAGNYKPNDSVIVKGKVTAYSGYGLSQAKVAYHITRNGFLNDYRFYLKYNSILSNNNAELVTDTIQTNDQGTFEIKFKAATADGGSVQAVNYRFNITADVTDGSGETRSANTGLTVGLKNITVAAIIPANAQARDSIRMKAGINNLNNVAQAGTLHVEVYALQAPDRLFKVRLWNKPDQYLMSREEYKKYFSTYAYRNEDIDTYWPIKNKVADITANAGTQLTDINLDVLKQQPTGTYKIVISAKNLQGDTVSAERYMHLYKAPAKPERMEDWVMPLNTTAEPGKPAEVLLGTGMPSHVLMEKINGSELLSSEWLNIPGGKQQLIKIPVEEGQKSLTVQFLMICGNRKYTNTQVILNKNENSKLDIRFITFRNKLQPGEKEEWKLQVSGKNNELEAAEMVANLYDASLDNIAGYDNWANSLNNPYRYVYQNFAWTALFVRELNTNPLKYNNSFNYSEITHNYEGINMLGYSYYGGYNFGYRMNLVKGVGVEMKEDALEYTAASYGVVKKTDLTGALSEVTIDQPVGNIMVRGMAVTQVRINGKDYYGGDKAEAITNLPADIVENIQVVDDYGDQASRGKAIATRKNFSETAFFYPQLHTNEKGEILIDFTIPESLTKWRFRAFAHTKDLKTGYIEQQIVTQKQLSISANTPRFLREGDTITVSARLANLTTATINGKVNLQLFNALNMQPVSLLLNPADAQQSFTLASATTHAVSFRIAVPAGLDAITYRITADGGQFTDGEENTIPVLPNRMLVTESMPMMVRSGQTKAFTFEKLINQKSSTLKSKTLTLEYTQNPAWYAVQALPYMMEFPYECSEQVFSRYYANSLATNLVNKMPGIKQIFDRWKATNSPELLSNLEKNPELKATLLEETPWLRDAVNESEQKKRIALLFDLNKMSYELELNLDKLQKRQLPDGGFPWFGGDKADQYITRHILAGIGQLYHLGITDTKNGQLKDIADKAMAYVDGVLQDDAAWAKKHSEYEGRALSESEIHAYYTESYYPGKAFNPAMQALLDNYLKLAQAQWRFKGVYEEGMMALTLLRYNKVEAAKAIIRSLTETAQQSNEMGMYWGKNQLGYYWYQSPVETQSLMIELFTEAGNHDKEVEEMKIWLLREKQTTNWKTTKATAAACYALLMKGDDWLADAGTSEIKLDGKLLSDLKPVIKAEAGTGYIKTTWADEQVKPDLGKVSIKNDSKTISWGALHWQYLENLDKITPSSTDIHLERKYFIVKQTDAGAVLTAVDATHQPKVGDLLKVVVYLKAGRDYEYVQLKDMRPAGTEPVDVLSNYKYQDGLWYYQVTKDVATNFFISNLSKGNYVFEYRLRVAQPGNFSTGISTVQCMYAPEFNAHSEGARMTVVK